MRILRGGRDGLVALLATLLLAALPIAPVSAAAAVAVTPPSLPGVPAGVTVEAWLTFDLEGDFAWQSTKLQAGSEPAGVIQVHHGFLIATDAAVQVSDPAFGIHEVPAGGALAMGEGQQLDITAPSGSARLMFVELVARGGAFAGEQPDSTKAFSVPKGRYTLAVLAVPSGPNAPAPAAVIAKAAAPAIAVSPEGAGAATPGAGTGDNGVAWLVALFPTP
ncbi:MAG: hypothetical protein ACTHQE_13250 [Thermomicrobiales bacterium]